MLFHFQFFFKKIISFLRLIIHVPTEEPKRKYKGTTIIIIGPGSSVGITTDYGLDGLGSNTGGNEIFLPSRPALRTTDPLVKYGR